MTFDVLAVRGVDGYLVQMGDEYCLVRLGNEKFSSSQEIGVFLKQGYFEDPPALNEDTLARIEGILSKEENKQVI
jgi:hypothetical protein